MFARPSSRAAIDVVASMDNLREEARSPKNHSSQVPLHMALQMENSCSATSAMMQMNQQLQSPSRYTSFSASQTPEQQQPQQQLFPQNSGQMQPHTSSALFSFVSRAQLHSDDTEPVELVAADTTGHQMIAGTVEQSQLECSISSIPFQNRFPSDADQDPWFGAGINSTSCLMSQSMITNKAANAFTLCESICSTSERFSIGDHEDDDESDALSLPTFCWEDLDNLRLPTPTMEFAGQQYLFGDDFDKEIMSVLI